MANDQAQGRVEQAAVEVAAYVNMRWTALKLALTEGLSKFCSSAITILICAILGAIGLMLLAGALTVWLSSLMGSLILGFVVSGAFFLLLAVVAFSLRKKLFVNSMVGTFSEMLFPEKDQTADDYEEE